MLKFHCTLYGVTFPRSVNVIPCPNSVASPWLLPDACNNPLGYGLLNVFNGTSPAFPTLVNIAVVVWNPEIPNAPGPLPIPVMLE